MELLSDEALKGALREWKAPIAIAGMLMMVWAVLLLTRPAQSDFNIDPQPQSTAFVQSPKPSPFAVPRPKSAPVRHFSTASTRRPAAIGDPLTLPSPQFLPVEWKASDAVPVSLGVDDSNYNR
jgi:hypothetical protein